MLFNMTKYDIFYRFFNTGIESSKPTFDKQITCFTELLLTSNFHKTIYSSVSAASCSSLRPTSATSIPSRSLSYTQVPFPPFLVRRDEQPPPPPPPPPLPPSCFFLDITSASCPAPTFVHLLPRLSHPSAGRRTSFWPPRPLGHTWRTQSAARHAMLALQSSWPRAGSEYTSDAGSVSVANCSREHASTRHT